MGPPDMNVEKKSPKRQLRSATVREKKTTPNNTASTRRPRPCKLQKQACSCDIPGVSSDERNSRAALF